VCPYSPQLALATTAETTAAAAYRIRDLAHELVDALESGPGRALTSSRARIDAAILREALDRSI